ncbi:MAG: heavy metal translocating P-type ATPase [Ruminococcaceae bacterium]|jgi:Cu2+-exporting ATPase|nr:heavy metal translocating P-type ATPase [Oscillospiraceae bacterium]
MEQFNVTGMSCAACSARVEKAVSAVEGVSSVSVSLLTNSMGVEGNASIESIISAVEKAGYGASLKGEKKNNASEPDELKDTQTPLLIKRFVASLVFLLVLMYFSMGHMFHLPQPILFHENKAALGLVEMLLSAVVLVINQRFFISGTKGLIHRAPNMDTLVALGSAASFGWSVYVLFRMVVNPAFTDHFYFESAAMILVLITVGKILESKSKGRTTDALKSLMKIAPKTAVIIKDGVEQTVPAEKVRVGDIFVVRPGDNIPVDGEVIEGSSAVDESHLTGESIPADKKTGDSVYAASSNKSGYLKCRAVRVGEDTSLSQIINMVSDAAATKAPIAKIADRVSGVFVPVVISIAVITFIIWMILGKEISFSLARAISVLVISCPCALGLATPVAIMVGNGVGAKNGILFKTAASLEQTGKTRIAVLDKTGTITLGQPKVTDVFTADGVSESDLLSLAYSLENKSEHPLATAVTEYAKENGASLLEITDFENKAGNGVEGVYNGEKIIGASLKYVEGLVSVPGEIKEKCNDFSSNGKTPLLFLKNDMLLGVIAVADVIKEDSPEAIKQMQNMGIRVIMLTGDNPVTANAIGEKVGVDKVIAGVLPDGKENVIRSLKNSGQVMMVGDGINDAPALTRADIGVAMGRGADIAIDAADVVIVHGSLTDVASAIRLSRATLRNIKQNLFWAFFYNVIGIPLAAGAYIGLFGWELNPMFGAAAMSLSSFFVVSNALRLNLFKLKDPKGDKKIKAVELSFDNKTETEEKKMTKTLLINGMMCAHCEAAVKKALEEVDGVTEAQVSHEKGTAVVTLSKDVENSILKTAVEDKDYEVTDIK